MNNDAWKTTFLLVWLVVVWCSWHLQAKHYSGTVRSAGGTYLIFEPTFHGRSRGGDLCESMRSLKWQVTWEDIFSSKQKKRSHRHRSVFFLLTPSHPWKTTCGILQPPSFSWLEPVVAKLLGSFASSKPLISDRSSCPAHQLVAGNSWTTWIKEMPRQVHMPFSTFPRNGSGATIGWCRRCHQEWDVAQQAEASYSGRGVHQNSGDEQLTISRWWGSSQVSEASLP